MSLQRKKVDIDPLSFFIEENQKKLYEDEEDVEELPVVKSVEAIQPVNSSSKTAEPREVKFAEPEPHEVKPALKSTKEPVQEIKKPKVESIDVLFSAEYNRKTEQLLSSEPDLFASEETSPNPTSVVKSTLNIKGEIDFHNKNDDDISDLKVAKLLEREEGLDENIFGPTGSSASHKIAVKKKASSEFDSEQNFLKELDEITVNSKSKYVSSLSRSTESETSASKFSTSKIADRKIEIDITSLDINSYINQEVNDSGGGLFD